LRGIPSRVNAGVEDLLVYSAFVGLALAGAGIVLGAILFGPRRRTGSGRAPFRMSSRPERLVDMTANLAPRTAAAGDEQPVAPLPGDTPARPGDINDYPLLANPHITLSGPVDQAMYAGFRDQLAAAPASGAIVVTISTLGGDPEVARLMGDEIRLLREFEGREFLFLGKVAVYSAGATFMSAFPVDKRFLTRGTRIMIHERIMNKTVQVSGPLKTCVATLKATLHEIEHSIRIEEEGFRAIVEGSRVDLDELVRRAPENWYLEAQEARDAGLVLDVI
jgi:ATP-dependent protease ClpP protease subunit